MFSSPVLVPTELYHESLSVQENPVRSQRPCLPTVQYGEGLGPLSRVTYQFPGFLTELPDSVIDNVQRLPGGEVQEVESIVKVGKCLGDEEKAGSA